MMDEEIRQALTEVREMKKMCGNINMKLTNIVTQRGQDYKKKLEAEYQRGLEEGGEQMPCDTCAYRHNNLLCTDCKWNYGSRYKVDSIGVGDVVIYNQKKCVVVTPETNEKYASLFDCNGNHYSVSSQNCQKTGEHYNINEILGGLCDD